MLQPSKEYLLELAAAKMPFGKYKNRYLIDLPEYYVIWYRNKGFPKGKLGSMLETVYTLKVNGLEYVIRKIQKDFLKDNIQKNNNS